MAEKPTESVVYVIGNADNHLVKIGTTTKHKLERLAGIQTMSPSILTVLWTTPGDVELEHKLHYRFRAERRHGEWFDFGDLEPVPTVAAAVRELDVREAASHRTPSGELADAVEGFARWLATEAAWMDAEEAPVVLGRCMDELAGALLSVVEQFDYWPIWVSPLWKQSAAALQLVRDLMASLICLPAMRVQRLPRSAFGRVHLNAFPDEEQRPADIMREISRSLPLADDADVALVNTGVLVNLAKEGSEPVVVSVDVPPAWQRFRESHAKIGADAAARWEAICAAVSAKSS